MAGAIGLEKADGDDEGEPGHHAAVAPPLSGAGVMSAPDLIERTGQALYGERWLSDLARTLRVNRKTVQRWRRGDTKPAVGVWRDLVELLHCRRREIGVLQVALLAARDELAEKE